MAGRFDGAAIAFAIKRSNREITGFDVEFGSIAEWSIKIWMITHQRSRFRWRKMIETPEVMVTISLDMVQPQCCHRQQILMQPPRWQIGQVLATDESTALMMIAQALMGDGARDALAVLG